MVRGLALRSMCSLRYHNPASGPTRSVSARLSDHGVSFSPRIPSIMEYLREPLQAGLGDRSAYVRKTAVMGTVKIFNVAPDFVSG